MYIAVPPVIRLALPFARFIVASVTIIDGKLNFVVNIPLNNPSKAPSKRPIRIATGIETPDVSNFDTTIPVKQATPPIERSSSPEIITKVTPIATMIITADCLTIFIKLAAAIKVLFKHVKIIHNTAITPNKPI